MADRIRERLASLDPVHVELQDETHMHSVPPDSESHWNLVIVSRVFEDKRRVQRHRSVYAALSEDVLAGIHALALKTITPSEWEALDRKAANPSPPCHGGSKANAG